MPAGTHPSDRRPNFSDRGDDPGGRNAGTETGAGLHHHRYYATDCGRRRHRYSSFSIMKWFRWNKRREHDEDMTWFRDDLKRIRQAYMEQESDYAAVTPVVPHRRPAATWSRWSGSTTTVYSFAYVDGARRPEDEPARTLSPNGRPGRTTEDTDDDDDDDGAVEYIDAATLQVPRRRTNIGRPQQCSTLARYLPHSSAAMTSTLTSTRRRNKRPAPSPPAASAAGPSSAAETSAPLQRRAVRTAYRKKYRAPQPPPVAAAAVGPRPSQQPVAAASARRRCSRKGPAPEPPAIRPQPQPQRPESIACLPEKTAAVAGIAAPVRPRCGSNVRQKISRYERDRLMERVDKIEKHFFRRDAVAAADDQRVAHKTEPANGCHNGRFASVAALYAAMAATNLSELDRRAAEACRKNRSQADADVTAAAAAAIDVAAKYVPPLRPAVIADDQKNAIVAAVIRKSYPATVRADAATDGKISSADRHKTASTDADDEKQLVRQKRLAFFTPRLQHAAAVVAASSPAVGCTAKLSHGTQTSVSLAGSSSGSKGLAAAAAVVKKSDKERSTESKNVSSEDNNCYQQLMAMEMQSDLVLHNGRFECAVCLCTYDNNGVVLRDCLHVFCRPCLQMTIGHSQAEQILCPYMDERYSCKGVLQHREIKKILDSEEEYERFLQRSVERARQLLAKERNGGSFQCRRPDCTGWCVIHNKNDVFEFKCPVCGTVTCVRCGSIHAPGTGCRSVTENNNGGGSGDSQDTLENLIDRGDAMPCPGCNTILSKQQGCDWIKCAVCSMEICWATKGPRWGPKGKGDTSAGCMCGIPPGRKCHTDCKYCH